MDDLGPDFFVTNGDMIHADGDCPEAGPDGPGGWENVPGDFPRITDLTVDWTDRAAVRDVYWRHWQYNRGDPSLQRFLSRTPVYAQWDDHDVIDDFGALWRDPTFNPNTLYAEGKIFDFGYARVGRQVDGKVHFLADVRGEDGETRPGSSLDLSPE